jgi:hypothetical protein
MQRERDMQLSNEELEAVVVLIDSLREFTKYGPRMHRQHIKTLLWLPDRKAGAWGSMLP